MKLDRSRRIDATDSPEERSKWKLVRVDNLEDIPGKIIEADEATGKFTIVVKDEAHTFDLGYNSIYIVKR